MTSVKDGTILVGFVIAFLVPSTTARRLPGSDHARHHRSVRREPEGRLRQHADDHDRSDGEHLNVGIKTAATQNMVAIGFIEKAFGRTTAADRA